MVPLLSKKIYIELFQLVDIRKSGQKQNEEEKKKNRKTGKKERTQGSKTPVTLTRHLVTTLTLLVDDEDDDDDGGEVSREVRVDCYKGGVCHRHYDVLVGGGAVVG